MLTHANIVGWLCQRWLCGWSAAWFVSFSRLFGKVQILPPEKSENYSNFCLKWYIGFFYYFDQEVYFMDLQALCLYTEWAILFFLFNDKPWAFTCRTYFKNIFHVTKITQLDFFKFWTNFYIIEPKMTFWDWDM